MNEKAFIGQIKEFQPYNENISKEEWKLDLTDKKILYLLGENGRLSTTAIGKKVRIKRETVAYRLKKMTDDDFLHGFLTLLDTRLLGFKNYIIYMKLNGVSGEKELLQTLFAMNEVTRLKNCSGCYDLQIIGSVTTEEAILAFLEEINKTFHTVIETYDIMQIIEEDFLGLGLLLDKENEPLSINEHKGSTFQKELQEGKNNQEPYILDAKDRTILSLLALDGRITMKDLSKKAGIAPVAVEHRIKKMIHAGIIKHFIPLASLSKIGYHWWKVFFKIKNINKKKFMGYIRYHPNILWYMRLLGKWDYQISIFAKDNAEFHTILDSLRTEFAENIIHYDCILVFNQYKYTQRIF